MRSTRAAWLVGVTAAFAACNGSTAKDSGGTSTDIASEEKVAGADSYTLPPDTAATPEDVKSLDDMASAGDTASPKDGNDQTDATDGPDTTDGEAATDCQGLDEEACAAAAGCHAFKGTPVEDFCAPLTTDVLVFGGCGPEPEACSPAASCGVEPGTGQAVLYADSCLPPGWSTCEATGCADECADLTEEECTAAVGCWPILGAPLEDYCAHDYSTWMSVFAGCRAVGGGCGEAETCARDPATGQALRFPSLCVPDGWDGCGLDPCIGGGSCDVGSPFAVGELCVRGESVGGGEELAPGQPLKVQVKPSGCFSTSCTTVLEASCAISGDGPFTIGATFCLTPIDDMCTDDCAGGGSATCTGADLAEGTWTVTHGDLSVTFDVPSVLEQGDACAGDPF